MKWSYLLLVAFIGAMILLVTKPAEQRQAQEAGPELSEEVSPDTIRILFTIETDEDAPVADILWFQKAAEVALSRGVPWFNVLEQKYSDWSVEGLIRLERDPMKAEYDANEILSLHLTDDPDEAYEPDEP